MLVRVVASTVVVFGVSRRVRRNSDSRQQEGQQQQNCHPEQAPSHVVTLERMFLLILLFLLGGVAEAPHPFPRGVVPVNPDGSTNSVLPGPLSWGACSEGDDRYFGSGDSSGARGNTPFESEHVRTRGESRH